MNDVQTFLREAWADTERTLAADRAEVLRQERARQEEVLRKQVSAEENAIANGWKEVGQVGSILVGIFITGLGLLYFENFDLGMIVALVGILTLAGVVVVVGMALQPIARTGVGKARIAKLNSEIASLQSGRRELKPPGGPE